MKTKDTHKLTHHEQTLIKQWIAEDWSLVEVLTRLKDQCGKEVSQPALSYYVHFYAKEIQTIREKINADVESVPISQKVVRQRRREDIYRRYLTKGDLEKARAVLDEAKEEMEPKQQGVHVGVRVDNAPNAGHRPDSLRRIVEAIERRTAVPSIGS